jgi:signal transduction histidine kinase
MDTNERLIQAVQLATRKLASTGNFNLLMRDVLAICVEAVGASGGTIYLHEEATRRLRFQHVLPREIEAKLPSLDIAEDFGMAGEAFTTRKTVCRDFPPKDDEDRNAFEAATGVTVRSIVAVPLTLEGETPIGVVQLLNKEEGTFNENDRLVLDTIAAVATMAYLNFRLTDEASRAGSLLGMGKVSHDIGNLAASLYSTLSFSSTAMTGLRRHSADAPDPKLNVYIESLGSMLEDLQCSVDRIVGYSRLISDISAGRTLRPDFELRPMAESIQTAAAYLEPEARNSGVDLLYEIDFAAPPTVHDELYVFRIVQNLVGNAIKAVKETVPDEPEEGATYGRVTVQYQFLNDRHILVVQDTGPGMSRDVADRILSGNARSMWDKASGSGWGTKIVLELASTHQAHVSIESEVGSGTSFRVEFPHRAII